MKYRPKTKPFPYQSKATIAAVKHRNFAVYFEPRLGKSKVALDYAGVMALRGEVKRVLIVFPAIARDTWEREIRKHFPYWAHVEDFDHEWYILDKDRPCFSDRQVQFFLAGREETFVRRKGKRGPKAKEIEAWDPDVVVVDESHEYKRPGGRGAQDLWRMIRRLRKRRRASGLPYVVLLSGTPNPKGWRDLFAQFRIMDETIFGTSAEKFDERHVIRSPRQHWRILKYRREKELIRKLRANSITMSADEAGIANKQFFETIKVDLPPKVKRMYLELAEEFMVEWEGGLITAKNAGVKRIRLLQLCGGFATDGQQFHGRKLHNLERYAKLLLEQDESVLVYSRFTPEVAAVYEVLGDAGFHTYRVDGSASPKTRQQALARLRTRPKKPSAISFQYQSGSRALELVGAAETVFYSPSDSWVDYWGALKRTQGLNQKRPVRYTHLICPGTVDVNAMRGLRAKEDWHSTMMRNPRRYLLGV